MAIAVLSSVLSRTHRNGSGNGVLTLESATAGWTCGKRDTTVVPFEVSKIRHVIDRCFQSIGMAEADRPEVVERITRATVLALAAHAEGPAISIDVEQVQRTVIQQLWVADCFDAAEHYQNYREERRLARLQRPVSAEHAARVLSDQKHFPTDLQYYQFIGKFSRWREEEKRRETWSETVYERVMPWFQALPIASKLSTNEWKMLSAAMYNLEAGPAMRVVQMAGPALDRCHVGVYNCAYHPIYDVFGLCELLYILMQGSGNAFSVEYDYVAELPRIKKQIGSTPVKIMIEDSTEGWCDAYKAGLEAWFNGTDVEFDYSNIRSAGTRLKTKGGRASGPEPLQRLMTFARSLILGKQGRFLSDLDVHDLCCMTGKIVQVGGVRRASCLSLSDLGSNAMRHAKSGNWYDTHTHRTMANNSATYDEKPTAEVFMEEWLALIRSGSGERGIFNRAACTAHMPKRRNKNYRFGTNPCVAAETWVPTTDGPRRVRDLLTAPFTTLVDGVAKQATEFVQTGVKQLHVLQLANGMRLRLTGNHRVQVVTHQTRKVQRTTWRRLDRIRPGDLVVLHNHRGVVWSGAGTRAEGQLLGSLLGDGCFGAKDQGLLDYWGETREYMRSQAVALVHATVGARSDCRGADQVSAVGKSRVQSAGLGRLAGHYGLDRDKHVSDSVEQTSSDFHAGFLVGWFDADGGICGSQKKGLGVRLSSVSLPNLEAAQRMLHRLGINSTIYANRREAGNREMPDGRGGMRTYRCQASHDLVIANDNLGEFVTRVGFSDPVKQQQLQEAMQAYVRKPNRDRFAEPVVAITPDGVEAVYDCAVPGPQAFDANGLYVHNCAEIILRPHGFCNLSIAVARPDDTEATLSHKVEVATYFGMLQTTCTNFRYIRPEWKRNAEEERLLGVDITGHADCPLLQHGAPGRSELLAKLKAKVDEIATGLAKRFGINRPAADTCVKPSGDSAVFFDCGSGISARYSQYQLRNVRESVNSPVANFLRDEGVPYATAPEDPSLLVFSFPKKAPEGCTLRDDLTAIQQLENWLEWKQGWAEHSVSATIYVEPGEWFAVGAWVYEHFDHITGLSFLPKDNGVYKHAPNEELTKEQYDAAVAAFPDLNWAKLCRYEHEDTTEASQTFACTAGACERV